MRKPLSEEELTKRFYDKHDKDLYEVDLSNYASGKSVVKLKCKEHGVLYKEWRYLIDIPCIHCHNDKKFSTKFKKFKEDCYQKFKCRFDYSDVVYRGVDEPVTIYCKEHLKNFAISPYNHLKNINGGCEECKISHRKTIRKYTTETIIDKFKDVHGDKYDYSQVTFKNVKEKVDIVCPNHGMFSMTPDNHFRGNGCRLCGIEVSAEKQRYTYPQLIEKISQFDHDYIVCLDGYINQKSEMYSFCPIHGIFNNKISSMLKGSGCIYCSTKRLAETREHCHKTCLYLISIKVGKETFIKVGCSSDVHDRISNIEWSLPKSYKIKLVKYYEGLENYEAYDIESKVLNVFEEYRGSFPTHFSGHSECLLGVDISVLKDFITKCIKGYM